MQLFHIMTLCDKVYLEKHTYQVSLFFKKSVCSELNLLTNNLLTQIYVIVGGHNVVSASGVCVHDFLLKAGVKKNIECRKVLL